MSEITKIEWADSTFNYWEGCQKAGPGCDNCYAEARNARFAGIKIENVSAAPNWGPGAPRRLTSEKNRNLPKRWNRQHDAFKSAHGRRQRVFCSSLSDVFDNAVDPAWRADLFALVEATPNLDWLVLTKRVGNVAKMVPARWMVPGGWPTHVRIGATIVNQEEADRDIPKLLALTCPNFLSMEPLLGAVDLTSVAWPGVWPGHRVDVLRGGYWNKAGTMALGPSADLGEPRGGFTNHSDMPGTIDWVIVGGESGPGARPMHPDWVRDLRDQCESAVVPFLFKQWGDWSPQDCTIKNTPEAKESGEALMRKCDKGDAKMWLDMQADIQPTFPVSFRVGKKTAGRLLDGRTWDGFPS